MLLQIHDELIFECLEKDKEYIKKTIKEAWYQFQAQHIICFQFH